MEGNDGEKKWPCEKDLLCFVVFRAQEASGWFGALETCYQDAEKLLEFKTVFIKKNLFSNVSMFVMSFLQS